MIEEKNMLDEWLKFTTARIGVGRSGTRPLTNTILKFRADHAAAVDAVYSEVDPGILKEFGWFSVDTCFETKEEYLKRPDKGRRISEKGVLEIQMNCPEKPQVQVVVSDGLSSSAVEENITDVYPALMDALRTNGVTAGRTFFIRGGRVGCMNHIGEILHPEVVVLLIGERPGLVNAASLSAYMCYRPEPGKTDSDRMVISNIHKAGTPPVEAGAHIGTLVKQMLEQKASGVKFVN